MHKAVGALKILVLLVMVSCGGNNSKSGTKQSPFENPLPTGNTAHLTGQQLAQGYCGSCHLFPDPQLLDKQTWKNGVLPNMALRLGLEFNGANPYAGMHFEDIPVVTRAGVFAEKPLISESDWKKIVSYYETAAPANPLPQDPVSSVKTALSLFSSKPLHFKPRKLPLTTLAKFDEATGRFFLSDKNNNLYILDRSFNLLDSLKLESPASDVQVNPDGSFNVLTLGVLEPSDRHKGKLTRYTPNGANQYNALTLLDSLNRPVEASYADLNQDGLTDIVICNYGNHTGALTWFRNKGKGRYDKIVLKKSAGSRNAVIQDFNQDGRPDIMVLVAQASESISIFYNQGQNKFEEKQVLRFPPVYGSSFLDVADFNRDGLPDILYTNGDNADYSVSLKKYHGLRIFLNDGRTNFKQAWFYPLHGAAKAIARDFDQDGDLDIAAISFFSDYQNKSENGFIYLENKKTLQFEASTFEGAATGHWLTLQAADVNQDGSPDLLLGSFIASPAVVPPPIQNKWYTSGPNAMLLLNKHQVKNIAQK